MKSVSEKMQILPTTGNEKAISSNDASHFNDFRRLFKIISLILVG